MREEPWDVPVPQGHPSPPEEPAHDVGNGQDGPLVVSGVQTVNTCTRLVSHGPSGVEVESASGFAAGRRVLFLQMQDVFATSGPTATVTDAKNAGQWEITRVQAASGSSLSVEPPLAGAYLTSGAARAQVCTVPEYTDVTVPAGATLTAPAWNGTTGGVLAFYANGIVTVDGRVSVDAAGFRGGLVGPNNGAFNGTAETPSLGAGGGKGEGLDATSRTLAGRGAMANGGGGGNAHNAGGGGGGNGGEGGLGGKQTIAAGDNPNTQGRAGGAVSLGSLPWALVAGGGGGTGHQNNSMAGAGGTGGGIALMIVNALRGFGSITADGGRGGDSFSGNPSEGNDTDGAGGGGAGGTIWLQVVADSVTGGLSASGGNGGDNHETKTLHGTGGGGGGGRVLLWGVSAAPVLAGGAPGVNRFLGSNGHGATPGVGGVAIAVSAP